MSTGSMIWAAIIGTIVVLIIYSMVSNRLRQKRVRKRSLELLPEVRDHIRANGRYRLVLNSGFEFSDVRFLGISHSEDEREEFLPFPLQRWLVLEKPDGKRAFVKPHSVRFYEEI